MLLNFPKPWQEHLAYSLILCTNCFTDFCTTLLFYSFISYGISVWGLIHPTVFDPLYKLQKKVVRAITFNNKYTHTTPLFYINLRLLKMNEIHLLKFLCFVDNRQGSPLQPFSVYFILVHSVHDHSTWQASKGDIFSSVNTTQYGKRKAKFALVLATLWNNLLPLLRESPSSRNVKNMLHELYFSLYHN